MGQRPGGRAVEGAPAEPGPEAPRPVVLHGRLRRVADVPSSVDQSPDQVHVLTAAESRFSGGSSSQVQSLGTMTVNPDCSFTMALSPVSTAGGAMNFFGIASADNKQLLIVQSDAATAVTGVMTAQ